MPLRNTSGLRGIAFCLLALAGMCSANGQENLYPSFIKGPDNLIGNDEQGLQAFYMQLDSLLAGKKQKVTIVHIGDSHLQADWFSGRLRLELHRRFGCAGRGLVFPYRVANTNSPPDVKSFSNVNWEVKRNIHPNEPMPVGISGITIRTYEPDFALSLDIAENQYKIDYGFNQITLFHAKGYDNFDFEISENHPLQTLTSEQVSYHTVSKGESLIAVARSYACSVTNLREWNAISGDMIYAGQRLVVRKAPKMIELPGQSQSLNYFVVETPNDRAGSHVSTVLLNKTVKGVTLVGRQTYASQQEAMIHGISLENNERSGILYHMIGVNGARFRHYNRSEFFFDQLQELEPDLIIVSLGTNEAHDPGFQVKKFYGELDAFVKDLQSHNPDSDILVTTPPDSYKSRRYINRNVHNATNVLLSYSINNGYACWDFYQIMGGEGSIQKWYQNGLAQRDRLHLTKNGYELQGRLLYDALLKGYASYHAVGPR